MRRLPLFDSCRLRHFCRPLSSAEHCLSDRSAADLVDERFVEVMGRNFVDGFRGGVRLSPSGSPETVPRSSNTQAPEAAVLSARCSGRQCFTLALKGWK